MKKRVVLLSILSCFVFQLNAQNQNQNQNQNEESYNHVQLLSPGYSFSSVSIQADTSYSFNAISHGLSLAIFRYGFMYKFLEFKAGMTIQWAKTKIEQTTTTEISYMGLAPEAGISVYIIKAPKTPVDVYLGFSGQFFVIPLISSPGINITATRPCISIGIKKNYGNNKTFGFKIFAAPAFASGVVGDIQIQESWMLGMELDIPGFGFKF